MTKTSSPPSNPLTSKPPLFKYLSPESTLAVLKGGTLKWSSPKIFNDPFDSQWNIAHNATGPSFDAFIAPAYKKLLTERIDWSKIRNPAKREMVSRLRQQLAAKPDELDKIIAECRDYFLKDGHDVLFQRLDRRLQQLRLLCLSEEPRSLLMWSHYAMEHQGAVLEIDPDQLTFTKFHRVEYVSEFPEVIPGKEWADLITRSISPPSDSKYVEILVSTKSKEWSYEREWRLVYLETDTVRGTSDDELVAFPPNAIRKVILGCRADSHFSQEVTDILNTRFPHVIVQRAAQSRSSFSLDIT